MNIEGAPALTYFTSDEEAEGIELVKKDLTNTIDMLNKRVE